MLLERKTKPRSRLILHDKMILRTDRLILRPLKDSDAQSVAENANNLNVSKWLLKMPYPYRLKDALEWIRRNKEKLQKRPVEEYSFGIEVKSEHKVVGGISLVHIDRYGGNAEVGYWLGERYRGQRRQLWILLLIVLNYAGLKRVFSMEILHLGDCLKN